MNDKIFPRNLTANAAHATIGNPVNTRLESSVANCFPGLEFDIRALDRRFFPGLVFEFITKPLHPVPAAPANLWGARLLYLDYLEDPMLPETSTEQWAIDLRTQYVAADTAGTLQPGVWYLHSVEQGGRRIEMYNDSGTPLDGTMVWRLVRCLEPGELTIALARRNDEGAIDATMTFKGRRRRYVDEAGVFDRSYRPGEFTASMCNPWTHDFRDCGCHYWASNHPDIVLGPVSAAEGDAGGGPAEPLPETYFDWLREDRSPAGNAPARATIGENRPYQIDHYQINGVWQQLPFVLEGHEIGHVYAPTSEPSAQPYASIDELIAELANNLAPMELTLAFEYLYALFSVRAPDEADNHWPTMAADLRAVRQYLTLGVAGEMTHLRWANQLLWELHRLARTPYEPILEIAAQLPGQYPACLRRLEPKTLDDFIEIERPHGNIDRAYRRCVATLRDSTNPAYPGELYEIAVRIDTDGLQHCERFREVKAALEAYAEGSPPYPYLRDVRIGTPDDAKDALKLRNRVVSCIKAAYRAEAAKNFAVAQTNIKLARDTMGLLSVEADRLARDEGIGVPFFQGLR